jgi:hypothetical protein
LGTTRVVRFLRAGGGGGGGGGGGAATNEMVMGGAGTDSTVMKEAMMSPPNRMPWATSAIGSVSHFPVCCLFFVDTTRVSNKNPTSL